MSQPKISVLICNYNHGRYLPQCLAGIQRQTFGDFEIVLTDDGSTDDSRAVIAQFAAADARIRPNYFPVNRGAMAAIEDTSRRAHGELVFGHGADDFVVDAHFFERAVAALDNNSTAAGFFGVTGLFSEAAQSPTGTTLGTAPHEGFISPAEFLPAFLRVALFVPGASSIWRRALVQRMGGFDAALGPQCDFYLNHALACSHGVIFDRTPVTCQRIFANQSNLGSKTTLWQSAGRFAEMERRFRERCVPHDAAERDWCFWRAYWMADAIRATGIRVA